MENGKYVNAVRVYQKTLAELENGKMGAQFAGTIWYNMGCAYSRLFQMDEAVSCFEKALVNSLEERNDVQYDQSDGCWENKQPAPEELTALSLCPCL